MRVYLGALAILVCIFINTAPVKGQVITAGPDSVKVPVTQPLATLGPQDDKSFFLDDWGRPAKAALFSAIIPGLGQAYNKAYWKVPVVYATGATLGYFIIINNNTYQDLRTALLIRRDNDPETVDKFSRHPTLGEAYPSGERNLRFNRDTFRRNRDLTILLSVLAYGLNVAEAYVHAHLKEFDVTDDLSLRVEPNLMQVPGTANATPAFTLTLTTKTK